MCIDYAITHVFIGACEQRRIAERLGGLQVDRQIEPTS
jgi:hypothetical protein